MLASGAPTEDVLSQRTCSAEHHGRKPLICLSGLLPLFASHRRLPHLALAEACVVAYRALADPTWSSAPTETCASHRSIASKTQQISLNAVECE